MKKLVFFSVFAFLLLSCRTDYDYDIHVGDEISIELESDRYDDGFSWCWDKQDNRLDSVTHDYMPYNPYSVGSKGAERWLFVGAHKGASTIRLDYKRPSGDSVLDSREYSVKVR